MQAVKAIISFEENNRILFFMFVAVMFLSNIGKAI
jgi:hypothetical protein